ncbi:MAG: hypothetical protein RL536_514 [Candidatus Parcubacteria bacterium]
MAVILAMIMTLPSVVRAEEGTSAGTSAGASVQTNTTGFPPVPKPGVRTMTALERLRAAKNQNIQNNESNRNRLLNSMMKATSSPGLRRDINRDLKEDLRDIREQGRDDMKNATSSMERKEIRFDMRVEEFMARKNALARELGIKLSNLKQIRARISSRIDKAVVEGKNMTEAKRLLVVADGKITLAEQAISGASLFNPTASSTITASSTKEMKIDLKKPRKVAEDAIKALKDAHKALVAVVVEIARNLGIGHATTTPPVVPPVVSTTTSTTTP